MNKNNIKLLFLASVISATIFIFWNYFLPTARVYYKDTNLGAHANLDFYAYYSAGEARLQGAEPYLNSSRLDAKLRDIRDSKYSRYIYPPTFMPIYSKLAKLDYESARNLWMAIYFTIFVFAIVYTIAKTEKTKQLPLTGSVLLITISSAPLLFLIRQGQIDLIIISLILFSFISYQKKQPLLSALFLALGFWAKINPAILLIYFLIYKRDWKYLIYFILCVFVIMTASLIKVPLEWYKIYFSDILPSIANGTGFFYNQSIIRMIYTNAEASKILSFTGFGIFALYAYFYRSKLNNEKNKLSSGNLAIADLSLWVQNLIIILLFSGISWHMTYTWLIVPSALLVTHLYNRLSWPYFSVLVVSIACVSSRLENFMVLNYLNMIGGILMLVFLILLNNKILKTNTQKINSMIA